MSHYIFLHVFDAVNILLNVIKIFKLMSSPLLLLDGRRIITMIGVIQNNGLDF